MSTIAVTGFVQEIRRYGRFDVSACLNCGSCTIACNLSTDAAPFPRRPIRRALLGLKSSVLAGLEPWLCHDCGDCSTTCPRQAEPRESMMTLRRYLAAQYDVTGLASKILTSTAGEIIALSVVGLLVFALVFFYHLVYKEIPMSVSEFVTTPLGLEHMFPTITYFTMVVFLIPLVLLTLNILRMHRWTMRELEPAKIPLAFYLREIQSLVVHTLSHRNIRKCLQEIHQKRWTTHWLLGLAVSLMLVVKFFFLDWFQTDAIYPIYHPQRWLGYLVAAVLIYVPLDILISRMRKRVEIHKFSEPSDVILPVMFLLVALSGLGVHIFRYLEFALTAHLLYAVHVAIAVPLVLIELPFGKWSHVVYRPMALYFQAVKERALRETETVRPNELPEEAATIGA
ncbi:MAG: 4Fe-4S dicluster domain-containing protein [Blastocatellia bacterium]|nr:4Fe-4S dicluster domain-containing protein [Blastocatellia bacterium]